jgi:hypothetical protein
MLRLFWFNFSKCVDFDKKIHLNFDLTSAKIRDLGSFESLSRCDCCDWRRDSLKTFDERNKWMKFTNVNERDSDEHEYYEILVKTIRGIYPKAFYFGNRNMMVFSSSASEIYYDLIFENFCTNLRSSGKSFTCEIGDETETNHIFFDSNDKMKDCVEYFQN